VADADADAAVRRRHELCVLEIGIVQDNIARFDSNGLQIKTWCATTWSALEAFAIREELARLAAAGVVIALVFGSVELSYRRFQWRFIQRAAQIEDLLERDAMTTYQYRVHRSASDHHLRAELKYSLTQAHFYTLYALLILLSLLTWWWL
jgi:hypothetical protein